MTRKSMNFIATEIFTEKLEVLLEFSDDVNVLEWGSYNPIVFFYCRAKFAAL